MTACIDECRLAKMPSLNVDMTMQSYVVRVGSTSCMVRVDIMQGGEQVTSSNFILAARHDDTN